MNWILQQPLVIIVAGLVAELILFFVLQQTGKKWVVAAMVAVAVLLVAVVGLERMVITPEEAIRAKLYEIAAAAQANDVDAVFANVSRRAPEDEVNKAKAQLKAAELEEVSVKGVSDFDVADPPERATALVRVKAVGSLGGYRSTDIREFDVTFVLEEGDWKVRGWEDLGNPLLSQP